MPTSPNPRPIEIHPDVFLFQDTCNVFLLRDNDEAVAFDFGSGRWPGSMTELGVRNLRHVFLTHAHRDQCAGLAERDDWPFEVHASGDDLRFYSEKALSAFWAGRHSGGCPTNYAPPRVPMPFVRGDVGQAAEIQWAQTRICPIPTPGHTKGALTYLVNWRGRSLAFAGDAVHSGGKIHQPYHLEWDHWTPEGALAAWYGLQRLGQCRIDLLCPSHGPVVENRAGACVRAAQRRLMAFVKAKGSICPNELDRWVPTEPMACGAQRVLPNLYLFGGNSFLLVGRDNEGFVVDPTVPRVEELLPLMDETGVRSITAASASHYHLDHSDGLDWLRDRFGTAVWLHPWVAEPIRDRNRYDRPWMTAESIQPDRVLPETGAFRWNRYRFDIHPVPGQTRWHCAFDTTVDGKHVLFSGDNYQPASRWNGTGGFCAYNGSRFAEGFTRSAQMVLDLKPDILANGHGCVYRYSRPHYRKVLRWSATAERAVAELCPSDDWLADYDCHAIQWEPFRTVARPGQTFELSLVYRNHRRTPVRLVVKPALPVGWTASPARRRSTMAPGSARRLKFSVTAPGNARKARHVVTADIIAGDQTVGEAAAALIDIRTDR